MPIVPSLQVEFVQEVLADLAAVSLTPNEIPDDGGITLQLYGIFQVDKPCLVEILVGGLPYVCYSADYGKGNYPLPLGRNLLFCSTPVLPISAGSSAYDVRVTQDGNTVVIAGALQVRARSWNSGIFNFRRILPTLWRKGASTPQNDLLVQTPVVVFIQKINAQDGVLSAFTPTVYSPQGGTQTWTSVGTSLPVWLVLNPTTGELTGTPGPGDVAETTGHALLLTVGADTFTTNEFTLEVTA